MIKGGGPHGLSLCLAKSTRVVMRREKQQNEELLKVHASYGRTGSSHIFHAGSTGVVMRRNYNPRRTLMKMKKLKKTLETRKDTMTVAYIAIVLVAVPVVTSI